MILDLSELKNKYSMNINGVIHIGAHFGEEHQTYKSLGIDNIVYFEPVKKTFDVLKEKVKDAILYNCALGQDNKMVEMFIEEADEYGCSSILQPSSNYDSVKFSPNELVEMKRLDDFNFKGYNFLNIDVQGYEYEVLKGSHSTLEHVDYILCEVNRNISEKKMDYIGAVTIDEIINLLKPYGFSLMEVSWAGLSWGDGFFVKQK
jgi:FkbM family methyltransferase